MMKVGKKSINPIIRAMSLCYIYIYTHIYVLLYTQEIKYMTHILFDTIMEKKENINTPVSNTQNTVTPATFAGHFVIRKSRQSHTNVHKHKKYITPC